MSSLIVEIREIESIESHPNADKLEIAKLKNLDWQCIVGKGEFKPGDLVVYIPIEAILPEELEEKIFSGSKVKLYNHRVKTIKLRGAISQGLIISLQTADLEGIEVGTDVSGVLKIIKYELPTPRQTYLAKGYRAGKKQCNPHFRKYTDIENFKNYPLVFDETDDVIVTEKIHGTNTRYGWVKREPKNWFDKLFQRFNLLSRYEFVYGSHNVQLQDKKNKDGFYSSDVYGEAVKKYGLKHRLDDGIVIYGEIYGDGIQKNYKYGCEIGEYKLVVFDVMQDGQYLDLPQAKHVTDQLGLDFVPILYVGKFDIDIIKTLASGESIMCSDQDVIEGVVIRPAKESKCYMGRKVLKYINDEYLLGKQSEHH